MQILSLLAIGLSLIASASYAQTTAFVGAKLHPVSGDAIDNGTLLIRDGKIVGVGDRRREAATRRLTRRMGCFGCGISKHREW